MDLVEEYTDFDESKVNHLTKRSPQQSGRDGASSMVSTMEENVNVTGFAKRETGKLSMVELMIIFAGLGVVIWLVSTKPIQAIAPLCPEGFPLVRPGSNSCYKMVKEPATWESAVRRCTSDGGYLVAVETSKENDWIFQISDGAVTWLGGSNEEDEENWVWVGTGQQFRYINWAAGEPNNWNGAEHFLAMSHSFHQQQWTDYSDGSQRQYVCETKI